MKDSSRCGCCPRFRRTELVGRGHDKSGARRNGAGGDETEPRLDRALVGTGCLSTAGDAEQ